MWTQGDKARTSSLTQGHVKRTEAIATVLLTQRQSSGIVLREGSGTVVLIGGYKAALAITVREQQSMEKSQSPCGSSENQSSGNETKVKRPSVGSGGERRQGEEVKNNLRKSSKNGA